MIQLIIIYFHNLLYVLKIKKCRKFRQGGQHSPAVLKEGFPAFCCRKSFSFLFLNTATHPPQTFRRTVIRGGGSCPVWEVIPFPSIVSILLRRSRLRQCSISARCRLHSGAGSEETHYAFGCLVFVFDVNTALIGFGPDGVTCLPFSIWISGRIIIELVEGQLLCNTSVHLKTGSFQDDGHPQW